MVCNRCLSEKKTGDIPQHRCGILVCPHKQGEHRCPSKSGQAQER